MVLVVIQLLILLGCINGYLAMDYGFIGKQNQLILGGFIFLQLLFFYLNKKSLIPFQHKKHGIQGLIYVNFMIFVWIFMRLEIHYLFLRSIQ